MRISIKSKNNDIQWNPNTLRMRSSLDVEFGDNMGVVIRLNLTIGKVCSYLEVNSF